MFNHGAILANVFSWGVGGEAMRDNFFRRATENPEALAANAKFLRGETLVETAATGFRPLRSSRRRAGFRTRLPAWAQKSGQQAQAMPLVQKLSALVKEERFEEADKVADAVLALMSDGEKR